MDAVFLYLLKATLCLIVFSTVYRWFFSGLTHFQWMRFYLIASVALSVMLPLIQVPAYLYAPLFSVESIASSSDYLNFDWILLRTQNAAPLPDAEDASWQLMPFLGYLLLGVYFFGVLYKLTGTLRNLFRIRQFITNYHKIKEGNYYLVYLPQNLSAFSFWRYIFLSSDWQQISAEEQQHIQQHELVHVRQKHTLDLLFFEIAGALFWFNPLMAYLKKALREVHEYLADAGVAGKGNTQKAYAHLLLKLAVQPRLVPLANSISGKQISRRIVMLTKSRSLPVQKLTFLLIFPVAALLLFLSACMDEPTSTGKIERESALQEAVQDGKKIRNIIWEGNAVYDDETLSRTLGLKTGNVYNAEILNQRLNYNPTGTDVSTLYMDHGYIFFNIEVEEKQVSPDVVDLVFDVFEGERVKVENIIIKGNQTVPASEIQAQIPIESGDVFNRSKLIAAQKAIAEMGYFDPQQIGINPLPYYNDHPEDEMGKMDIEFVVVESKAKQ